MCKKFMYLFSIVFVLAAAGGVAVADPWQQDPGPDGIVSVEAENYDANVQNGGHGWVLTGPTGNFTGTAGMWAPNGQGGHTSNYATNSERLDYEINFVKTGIHYVWILAWGASGSDDSCHAGLDGDATLSSQMSDWSDNYRWSNNRYQQPGPSRIDVTSTGPHTLNIWVREDGLIVDKIVVTSNPNFSLSGNEPGPPESIRGAVLNAYAPDPADGGLVPATWANLSWSAGTNAASHDVYLGENFDDVNNRSTGTFAGSQPSPFLIVGFLGAPYPDGLVPGTTYYWRVDEVEADGKTKHEAAVWSFRIPQRNAYDPIPADGAVYQDADLTLNWSPGLDVKFHTVYFGGNFEDVNSGAVPPISRATADYTPGPLEHDKTYYWRVDQVNPPATAKGEVWSFTTLPEIPITDPSLVGWWKFEAGKGTKVVDWSGHGNHGTIVDNVRWVSSMFNMGLEFLGDYQGHVELPPGLVTTGAGSVLMWINTTQGDDEGMLWYGSAVNYGNSYGGENEIHINIDDPGAGELDFFLEEDGSGSDITINGPEVGGQGWTHVAATWDLAGGCKLYVNGVEVGSAPHNTNVKDLAVMRLGSAAEDNVYYEGIMDDVRLFNRALTADEIVGIYSKGEDPRRPGSPQPANSALVTLIEALPLGWSPGEGATGHDVYFGTDGDAVAGAKASDTTGIYRGRQNTASYTPPEGVEWAGGPYYWRIDEIAADGTVTKGGVWNFTVADYLIVDDFESYNDIPTGQAGSHLVYETWLDGYGTTTNGSAMGYTVPFEPTMETGIVYGGRQSVPLAYDNSTPSFSEVTVNPANLAIDRNWTTGSPKALVLWLHGNSANAITERMYVKINGVKVTYPGPAADIARARWSQWNIDLTTLGVNLGNVTQFAIGFERTGGAGGTGTVLIDEIRLYQSAPPIAPPSSEEIWIEAEATTAITAPMQVYDDPTASGGRYISTDESVGDNNADPPADGIVTYNFTVAGGIYKVSGRLRIPSASNSFWVRIQGATTPPETELHTSGWIRWNDMPDTGNWLWSDVFSDDDDEDATVLFAMPAGTYTLEIARREDGAQLDVIVISKVG